RAISPRTEILSPSGCRLRAMAATDSDTQPSGTTPGGVVGFLLARIAEDESVARESPFDRAWTAHPDEIGQPIKAGGRARIATCAVDVMNHIARHDPARVLAECQAKRFIVTDHNTVHECPGGPNMVSDPDIEGGDYGGPCATLRQLAAVYA